MTIEEKKKIISVLMERSVKGACPRCNNQQFTLVDGYFNQPLQTNLNSFVLGGPSLPFVAVTCTNCGFISQHALGALGLLPPKDDKESTKEL